nr:SMC-like protein [Arabidopsis thaliana]AAD54770.1 SMC-like protein [Arabidopsis thaliana]
MVKSGARASDSFIKQRSGSGSILRIKVENFMCHSYLQIEFGEWVNFITGQNGSGKSAILTALCIAFGCRARGTQRAATLKDFIKTGCSYAVVQVEMKNSGEDAFKSEIYGGVIIIERRITESATATVLKDYLGKKVSNKRDELRELVEHFNIDVENPCVVMSQDKAGSSYILECKGNSSSFLRNLLQQVNDLLQSIYEHLTKATAIVDELENTIKPIEKEISELRGKIKNMEQVEEIAQRLQQLKKKLAWSWVYDVGRQLQEQTEKIVKLKERIPTCQAKIDWELGKVESLRDTLTKKKAQVACLMDESTAMKREIESFHQSAKTAVREKIALQEEFNHKCNYVQKIKDRVRRLERQVGDINEQTMKNTQAEQSEIEEKLKYLEREVEKVETLRSRLKEEENCFLEKAFEGRKKMEHIEDMIKNHQKRQRFITSNINDLKKHQTNKVTAFGGDRVINLLQAIERNHRRFRKPPIGPIGSHVTLVNGNKWASSVEQALGTLLNAFIVTDHKDSLTLRGCANEANYRNLKIIIYDFSRPRLNIPRHMVPQTEHPTIFSVIDSDNPTFLNVLVDQSGVERQVLAENYEEGKAVAFGKRLSNLKEVYTLDGYKMFFRGPVQTTLPPLSRRPSRLCASFDDQIKDLEIEASKEQNEINQCMRRKREAEENLEELELKVRQLKKHRSQAEKVLTTKELEMHDLKNTVAAEIESLPSSSVNELQREIMKDLEEIDEKEAFLEKLQNCLKEAELKANKLTALFENMRESAKGEIDAFEEAENELKKIEKDLQSAEAEKIHYENIMKNKVLPDIKNAEANYEELKNKRKESDQKASEICPESEIESLGPWDGSTPEQLSAQITRMNQRLHRENQQFSESIDDLRMMYESLERKIAKKRKSYQDHREKLMACKNALDSRWAKFQRNASLLRRQLTWQFNAHLGKKGISGHIKVSYENKTLSIEVKMPQDATSNVVRDTKGLSGGERSFSTLCFALALHEMTEAPFRAMDEFDVFMDAVSRKISLDALVDFAIGEGSQWMFITPHDISMVKSHERIKKQQMAAPRS